MKKALLIDFDNTLVGSEEGNFSLFSAFMIDKFGHGLCAEDYDHVGGNTWKYIFRYISYRYGKGAAPEALRAEFIDRKRQFFASHAVELAKGYEKIMALPVKKAIVTGSCMEEIKIFDKLIDFDAFDAIVTDDITDKGKPDAECYLTALRLLKVDACDALAVEDSRIGITSAKSAGIFTVFSKQFADEDHSGIADATVENFEGIKI